MSFHDGRVTNGNLIAADGFGSTVEFDRDGVDNLALIEATNGGYGIDLP